MPKSTRETVKRNLVGKKMLRMRRVLFSLIAASALASVSSAAEPKCVARGLTALLNSAPDARRVWLDSAKFSELLMNLRKTLAGKLATVWRAELKTKLTVGESNQKFAELLGFALPRNIDREAFFKNLDPSKEGYVREVEKRMIAIKYIARYAISYCVKGLFDA